MATSWIVRDRRALIRITDPSPGFSVDALGGSVHVDAVGDAGVYLLTDGGDWRYFEVPGVLLVPFATAELYSTQVMFALYNIRHDIDDGLCLKLPRRRRPGSNTADGLANVLFERTDGSYQLHLAFGPPPWRWGLHTQASRSYLADALSLQEGHSRLSLRWLVAVEAALAVFLLCCRSGQLTRSSLHLVPRSTIRRSIGRAMVARVHTTRGPKVPSPSASLTWVQTVSLAGRMQPARSTQPAATADDSSALTDNVKLAHGLGLHLSSRPNGTGYEGVTFIRSRISKPYRARAPGGVLIGYFMSAIEAAEQYARHVGPSHRSIVDVPSTFESPDGEVTTLHVAPGSSTGYRGVSLVTARNSTKPYAARIGPAAVDFVGYYSSAVEAAVAVAHALHARDAVINLLSTPGLPEEWIPPGSPPRSALPDPPKPSQPASDPVPSRLPGLPGLDEPTSSGPAWAELGDLATLSEQPTLNVSDGLPDDVLGDLDVDCLWPDA